jgi:hypothetical protein
MSEFPGSPRILKGALIGMDKANPLASVITFQYNPEKVNRSLQSAAPTNGSASAEVLEMAGPPKETITMKIEIEAADQLERRQQPALSVGIYPQLSALEMLLYPKLSAVLKNDALCAAGAVEIEGYEVPLTLLVWGPKRVVPVRVTSFTIEEQAFDVHLNPINATVDVSMDVLTYMDFPRSEPGRSLFMAHQAVKEAMAVLNLTVPPR